MEKIPGLHDCAFPHDYGMYSRGMTLIDFFATQAMITLVNQAAYTPERVAKEAYIYAKAMMHERDKYLKSE